MDKIPPELLQTIVITILGSTGFWQAVQVFREHRSAQRMMLMGLGHERLIENCKHYIERGWISIDELEDLDKYLYQPYRKMGGNGTGEMIYQKVKNLPNEEVKQDENVG